MSPSKNKSLHVTGEDNDIVVVALVFNTIEQPWRKRFYPAISLSLERRRRR
jgi:hypothetical protein